MDPQDAIDLSREAIRTCIFVGGPILLVCLLIGLLISVFQAMTQLHDQTISFVPKILLLLVAIGLSLPWLSEQMMDFAKASFEKPMIHPGFSSVDVEDSSRPTSRWTEAGSEIGSGAEQSQRTPRIADAQTSKLRTPGYQAGFRKPVEATVPKTKLLLPNPRAESQEQIRKESPFLLPHYRYEADTPADPTVQEPSAQDMEG